MALVDLLTLEEQRGFEEVVARFRAHREQLEPDEFARLVVLAATEGAFGSLLMVAVMAELGWTASSPLHVEDEALDATLTRSCRDFAETAIADGAGRAYVLRRADRLADRLGRRVARSSSPMVWARRRGAARTRRLAHGRRRARAPARPNEEPPPRCSSRPASISEAAGC